MGAKYSPKMIVVSNRLPFVLKQNANGEIVRAASAGGLVTAVAPVVVEGKGLWVGWPGNVYTRGMKIPESSPEDKSPTSGLKSANVIPVELESQLYNEYYNGCCNATFWPLFHLMPDRAIFSFEYWKAYQAANDIFGAKAIEALQKLINSEGEENLRGNPPILWLHDYHLMLAANTIRESPVVKQLKFKLGFFLHIPFPPWDILRIFPWADDILQGLLGNDMVGFHTRDYCLNFIDCCRRSLGLRVDTQRFLVDHGGRTVRVCTLPIGIPFHRFEKMAKEAPAYLDEPGMKLILGVDRLDYTKGIRQRLLGFERLLEKHPDYKGKIVMIQVAVPSRTDVKEYIALKEEMDQLVGRINGKFSTHKWSPIRYIYGTVNQEELAAYYRDSDVALITPLRDGMNLVAKEFVACQVKEPPGVLIISPFAGAAETMEEALICNPYEIEDIADTLHRALTMPDDEKTLRNNYLRQREVLNDVHQWMRSFLVVMGDIVTTEGEELQPTQFKPASLTDFDQYLGKFLQEKKKLALLLDFDGTLAPIVERPELAQLPPETKNILLRLSQNPEIHISIVSGRAVNDVKTKVGIDNITYAGNHGLEVIHSDNNHFLVPMPLEFQEKSKQLLKELQDQVCKEGAWVENKGVTMTFHYRETPVEWRTELVSKAREIIESHGFRANHAHAALEARPPIDWHKGRACIYILRTAFGLDWSKRINIIYVGDDVTDEDAMKALKGMATSFRVTLGLSVKTVADYRLPSTECVVTLLKWVEKNFPAPLPTI